MDEAIIGATVFVLGWIFGHNWCWNRLSHEASIAATLRNEAKRLSDHNRFLERSVGFSEFTCTMRIGDDQYHLRLREMEDADRVKCR